MRYWLQSHIAPVKFAIKALGKLGIEPVIHPTRGYTDGSRLTEMGVSTPNLFTGMKNIHGPLESISVQELAIATKFCSEIIRLAGQETEFLKKHV